MLDIKTRKSLEYIGLFNCMEEGCGKCPLMVNGICVSKYCLDILIRDNREHKEQLEEV